MRFVLAETESAPARRRWPLIVVVLTSLAATVGVVAVALAAQPPPRPEWSLVFGDDFTGAAGSRVSGNWQYDLGTSYPGGPPNWGTGEVEAMTDGPTNVALDGTGNLRITPVRDAAGNWTSGRIETQRSDFQPPAGGTLRVEGRIQMPNVTGAAAQGYWPAFWMLGAPYRGNLWNWPGIGEIDILENVQGINQVWATMHCGTSPGGPCNEKSGIGNSMACPGSPCQSAFHTYAVEWDRSVSPERLRWYVDSQQFHTASASQVDAASWANATDHGFYILLNVAMGGEFPAAFGGGPTEATVSGRPMVVDYVAAWQSTRGTPSAPPPPSPSEPPPSFSEPPPAPSQPPSAAQPDGDFTHGVTALTATEAKVSFTPTAPSSLVDIHYVISGRPQQNFRMTDNGGTWEHTVGELGGDTVIGYWFTYEKDGPLYDSRQFTYIHNGGRP